MKDWWSLGILIFEMIAGIDPFNSEDPMSLYQNILENNLRFPINFDRYFIFFNPTFFILNIFHNFFNS